MEVLFGYVIIFLARVIDMSLSTVRTLMVMQSRKIPAAVIGFFEVGIYIVVLGKVVNELENPMNLLAYCAGFATGNYVGIVLENKIALGNLSAQIILRTANNYKLVETLRKERFGVTIIEGQGIEGPREILNVALNRKDLQKLKQVVDSIDPNAYVTVNSISPIRGGYFGTMKKW